MNSLKMIDVLAFNCGSSTIKFRLVRVPATGGDLAGPLLIDGRVEKAISEAAPLAPLHNPPALAAIRATRRRLGRRIPMSASFDTSFHRALPEHARRYALPVELADTHQIRRYGFHGLAHRWMTERAADLISARVDHTKLITLQLGNGCSMAAVAGGRSIATSMGYPARRTDYGYPVRGPGPGRAGNDRPQRVVKPRRGESTAQP